MVDIIGRDSYKRPKILDMYSCVHIFSGIISGIIGGLIVGALSGSRLGVSGPAAGLITIILAAFVTLGSYQAFLVAVVIFLFLLYFQV